jgi:hypothetical protein
MDNDNSVCFIYALTAATQSQQQPKTKTTTTQYKILDCNLIDKLRKTSKDNIAERKKQGPNSTK